MPLESAIQLRIIAALRAAGAYVTKFSAGDVGTPDLLVCYQGRFFGMEVKQPKNYPTPIQRHRLGQIALAGGVGVVVRSVADALAALEMKQPPHEGMAAASLDEGNFVTAIVTEVPDA